MALQVYADGNLVVDTRLQDYGVAGLTLTSGLNKAGTANIRLVPNHPSYHKFVSYKTIVTIWRDGVLAFRGRVLYPQDDFYGFRTVVCEGERGFFHDVVKRPYLLQDAPEEIFRTAIAEYNQTADPEKRFEIGKITVKDPNDYVRMECESAEKYAEFLKKLTDRCGGYITFSGPADHRTINWLADIGTKSQQPIAFGENLLDLTVSGESAAMATAILPYGAQTEHGRLTIESVAGGKDYIQDDEAVKLRGLIMETVTWDDVTDPAHLLRKAQQWLAIHKLLVTSVKLSAADLSKVDRSIGAFHLGDQIQVTSPAHGLKGEWFMLIDRTEDLLDPAGGSISLGRETASMISADVEEAHKQSSALDVVKKETAENIQNAISATMKNVSTLIDQTASQILLQATEDFVKHGDFADYKESVSAQLSVLSSEIQMNLEKTFETIENVSGEMQTQYEQISKCIRFTTDGIIIGEGGNQITLRLDNDRISFMDGGLEVAWITQKQLSITDASFLNSLRIGKFAFLPRRNGNLSLVKVGD